MHVLDHFDPDRIRALCRSGEFFWLALPAPPDGKTDQRAEIRDLPPLAVEDTKEFNQRAKIDDYEDRLLIVFYGAQAGGEQGMGLVEVHMHLTQGRGVTVHREPCTPFESMRSAHPHSDHEIVYRLPDSLSERTLCALRALQEEVPSLEQCPFARPSAAGRRRIVELRGRLFRLL